MADAQPRGLRIVELTDEEKAVLRDCRINSVYFRGVPLGIGSALVLRQAIKYGLPLPFAKRFPGIFYTGIFGVGFIAGITSYHSTCVEKIMRLENSRLADQVRASRRAQSPGSYKGDWQTGNYNHEQKEEDLQGKAWSNRVNESLTPPSQGYVQSNITTPSSADSSEEAPPPPSLYFDVGSDKENKQTSYAELRKKHRERWMPPNAPSPGSLRSEKRRDPQQRDVDSKIGSSETPSSWFEKDNNINVRSNEINRETGQLSSKRPPYRQGPPPKKNQYGDVVEE
ncbi:OCIA domain-containing protein 1-like [Acropora muricata]|uniref:OCIA domain-containing protein 1-like n=1 Tax=Acropora muricata TaxID=159855 RepID=UPI0034E3F1AC